MRYFREEFLEKLWYQTSFTLTSINRVSWKSNIIHMLVIDRLVHLILLSLTFMHLNQLIIDVEIEIVMNKHCRYNIMIINSKTTVLKTKEETNALLEQKQSYIEDKKPLAIKRSPKLPTLGAKKNISWEYVHTYLQELNRRCHMEFTECFEGIPHAHKLLMDIYHCIKLKDSSQIFIAQTYLCL